MSTRPDGTAKAELMAEAIASSASVWPSSSGASALEGALIEGTLAGSRSENIGMCHDSANMMISKVAYKQKMLTKAILTPLGGSPEFRSGPVAYILAQVQASLCGILVKRDSTSKDDIQC